MNNLDVKIKKLNVYAIIPQYQTPKSSGVDLHANIEGFVYENIPRNENGDLVLSPGKRFLVKTGLAFGIPDGFEMQLRPRSGLALKNGITLSNAPATIDADYVGDVGIILENRGDTNFFIAHGDRIAQAVFAPVVMAKFHEVDELEDTIRGEGGFGSTNKE